MNSGQKKMSSMATLLAATGAVNWGLVGVFDWDLVSALTGETAVHAATSATRMVYMLVGLAGLMSFAVAVALWGEAKGDQVEQSG